MVRSLLVIGVLVAVVVLAVPRPQGRIQQPVDVAGSAELAIAGGLEVTAPDVPADWTPNTATFRPDPVEGLPTWSVGYLLPGGAFAGLRVTRGATPAWLGGVTSNGREPEDGPTTRQVAGEEWQVLVSDGTSRRRSLVLADGAGVTTVVTGTAADEDLDVLAAAARESLTEP